MTNTNVFIKIHPNGMPGSKEKTIDLVNSFEKHYFHILDESVSNLHIIDLKPTLIATARGTVCVEMAYFEIPTVALYDNLYANFNFVNTCQTTENYFAVLRGEIKPIIDFDKQKIYSFYYQAFLEKVPTEENNIMKLLATFKGDTYNDPFLKFILENGYPEKRQELIEYYRTALES